MPKEHVTKNKIKTEGIVKKPRLGVIAKKIRNNKSNLIAIILIIVSYAILFFLIRNELLFTPDFGESDAYHLNLSLKYLLAQSLKSNTLPFWTEALQSGFPIFAESQIGALFLPNLFFLKLFPFVTGYNLLFVFSLFSLTCGMYFLLREYKTGKFLSLILAYTFTFGGALSLRWVHINLIQTYSLFPFLFLIYLKYKQTLSKKYFILFSVVLSQMIFAGHFQVVFICLLGLSTYIIGLIWKDDVQTKLKHICNFFLMVISGLTLSLPQILPTLTLISQSSRQFLMDFATVTAFPFLFKNLISFMFPYYFGNPKIGTYPPFSNNWGIFWENTPYLGIIFFVILFFSLIYTYFSHTKKSTLLIKIVSINLFFFVLLILGKNSPLYLIFEFPPFNLFRTPSKYLLMVHFFLILLMAFVISDLSNKIKKRWVYFAICFLLLTNLFLLIKFTYSYHLFLDQDKVTKKPAIVQFDNKLDYVSIGQEALWNEYFVKRGWNDKRSIDNYIFFKNFLYPNSGALYGVNNISINTGAFRLWRKDWLNSFILSKIINDERKLKIDDLTVDLLRLYKIGHIITSYNILSDKFNLVKTLSFYKQNINLYSLKKNINNFFYIPKNIYKISSMEDFSQAYMDKKISEQNAFLEIENLMFQSNNRTYKIKQSKNTNYEIGLQGEFNKETFIVFNKNYYPEWQVYIDGKKSSIIKTNIIQIGVFIPQGNHTIILKYENKIFKMGIILSITYFTILLGVCLKKSESIS